MSWKGYLVLGAVVLVTIAIAGAQFDLFDEIPLRTMGFEVLPTNPVGKQDNASPHWMWN